MCPGDVSQQPTGTRRSVGSGCETSDRTDGGELRGKVDVRHFRFFPNFTFIHPLFCHTKAMFPHGDREPPDVALMLRVKRNRALQVRVHVDMPSASRNARLPPKLRWLPSTKMAARIPQRNSTRGKEKQ